MYDTTVITFSEALRKAWSRTRFKSVQVLDADPDDFSMLF
jgi:hypothetical protein